MGEIYVLKDLFRIILCIYTVFTESVHENPAFLSWEKCLECSLLHKEILTIIHQSPFTLLCYMVQEFIRQRKAESP